MNETRVDNSSERSELRTGHAALVVLLSLALMGVAGWFFYSGHRMSEPVILGILALCAMLGIALTLAMALGLLQPARQRNDLPKALADSSNEGLIVIESDGHIAYENDAYRALVNRLKSDDLPGPYTIERLFNGAPDIAEAIYRLAQAAREGRAAAEEIRLVPKNTITDAQKALVRSEGRGELSVDALWFKVSVRPIHAGGRRAALWGVVDITRDRERQESVFRELQHAIDYLDHAPSGFLSLTAQGQIIYMNATLARWLDHDLAQVGSGGLTLLEVVPPNAAALIGSVTGAPGEERTETLDVDFRKRGGQSLPVRLFHRIAFDAEGRPLPSRTLVLNRSPGEDVAEGQRAAEVRFSRFFNNTPVAIATVDRQGLILRSNASFARLFGVGSRSHEGHAQRSILGVVSPRDREGLANAVHQAAEGIGDIAPIDIVIANTTNSVIPSTGQTAAHTERSARFYFSGIDDGELDGEVAIVYALDITEQRALEAQFAQAQKMQAVGQLAGGVAHDFNNVLQAIIGYSDLLLSNHRPTDPSFQDIMQIKQNANRAAALVRQLLAFSRRQTLRPNVIQLGDELSELSEMLRRLLGERISLELHHGSGLWEVKADATQFQQVIVNLAVNARDAMKEGGKVIISTSNVPAADCARYGYNEAALPHADYTLIEVSDTGSGIPPDVLDKIFEPFFTTKEIGKGTGLGLSMVYGIVQQSGGYIFCDSVIGEGTVFRIFLPRHMRTETPQIATASKQREAVDVTGRGTVLLVEDEEAVRKFASRALTSRGYTVIEAVSGTDALAIVDKLESPVDLVVSDVMMPEMDGPTLLTHLRSRFPDLKVIFVSGYAEDAFEKNLPEGENFSFLPKPFGLKELGEAVKKALG
ncbi:cell cycle histidine kinase CckA [Pseudochelatococcus sp. G4_1912]|uniref:cell cycle histidine kinase CckA n=1 Tax=Pseudochelatococcus sp. G4_1912 TaxID=3114288 RepID=UPI0039C60741